MKVDVTQPLDGFDGKALYGPPSESLASALVKAREALQQGKADEALAAISAADTPEPVTLRFAATNALMANLRTDENQPGKAKLERYSLAQRIHTQDQPDIGEAEAEMLKERINATYGAAVVAPAWMILNQVIDEIKKPDGAA
jgi:hypothetical protein